MKKLPKSTKSWVEREPKKGRPPKPDIFELCLRKAEDDGEDLEDLLWGVMKGLMIAASRGNAKCGKLVFEYLGKPLPPRKDGWPLVNIDARKTEEKDTDGPPIPTPDKLSSSLERLVRLVHEGEPLSIIDAEVVANDDRPAIAVVADVLDPPLPTIEELLS